MARKKGQPETTEPDPPATAAEALHLYFRDRFIAAWRTGKTIPTTELRSFLECCEAGLFGRSGFGPAAEADMSDAGGVFSGQIDGRGCDALPDMTPIPIRSKWAIVSNERRRRELEAARQDAGEETNA